MNHMRIPIRIIALSAALMIAALPALSMSALAKDHDRDWGDRDNDRGDRGHVSGVPGPLAGAGLPFKSAMASIGWFVAAATRSNPLSKI
jgi:hypothetical protein